MSDAEQIPREGSPVEAINKILQDHQQAAKREAYAVMFHHNQQAEQAGERPVYSDETQDEIIAAIDDQVNSLPKAFEFDINNFMAKQPTDNGKPYQKVELYKIIPDDMQKELNRLRGESLVQHMPNAANESRPRER